MTFARKSLPTCALFCAGHGEFYRRAPRHKKHRQKSSATRDDTLLIVDAITAWAQLILM